MNDVLYNGVLYTIDGEVFCEFPEFKIDCYKDKTVIKIHCTNCCVVRKVQKWKFDCAEQCELTTKWFYCRVCGGLTEFRLGA